MALKDNCWRLKIYQIDLIEFYTKNTLLDFDTKQDFLTKFICLFLKPNFLGSC
jgi:hypothetical protein